MFLYEMAYNLRMPVSQVLEMPQREFMGWCRYFKVRPPEWRMDQRTAMICKSMGTKAKAEELFPTLQAVFEHSRKQEAAQKRQLLNNSFFTMATAKDESGAFDWLKE